MSGQGLMSEKLVYVSLQLEEVLRFPETLPSTGEHGRPQRKHQKLF